MWKTHIKKNLEEKHKIDVSQGLLLSVSVRGNKVATSSSVGSISVVGKLTLVKTKIKFIKISPIFALNCLLNHLDTATMKETDWLPCHDDAEAWIVTLGPNDRIFTGGDDSYFRYQNHAKNQLGSNLWSKIQYILNNQYDVIK